MITEGFETAVAWLANMWWLGRRIAARYIRWWLGAPRRIIRTGCDNFVDNVWPRRWKQ